MPHRRQAREAATPPAPSIAAVWTPTAAIARVSEPDADADAAGTDVPVTHSGISAGTSIKPAPWPVETMKDQRARPADPAGMHVHFV
ncbi:MAG TPA: hypothetical protein VFY73_25155 [Ideonella sp.]|uniref:hypothetical protein n=1 Tax=Ideonella sp. TaxID=1929293 RepID=UPI002E32E749|nr:hypothetical protein [Ideonella sp.]HEX5687319.1 hypothetical protein [Ideonella sp.]